LATTVLSMPPLKATATDFFGHSYYISNPRVSADIVAMLRYGLRPNEPGRPLEHIAGSFWRVPGK
jgi:hypothetical protein